MAKSKLDYFKAGMLLARVLMTLALVYLGTITFTEPGERTYNKFLHAVRKMSMPNSKPGDEAFASITFD